jgi:hypothetical protein
MQDGMIFGGIACFVAFFLKSKVMEEHVFSLRELLGNSEEKEKIDHTLMNILDIYYAEKGKVEKKIKSLEEELKFIRSECIEIHTEKGNLLSNNRDLKNALASLSEENLKLKEENRDLLKLIAENSDQLTAQSLNMQFELEEKIEQFHEEFLKKIQEENERKMSELEKEMKDQHFSSELPNHWTQFSDDEYRSEKGVKLVNLSANSSEYQNVIAKLNGSIPNVKAIYRVQNPLLYLAHQFYKFNLQKKYPEMPISEMERKLFHGTNSAHKTAIAQQGFDFRMNGKNGTSMGKGSYFAVNSGYSIGYCQPNGIRTMFLASVLVGKFGFSSPAYVRPPIDQASGIILDSVTDNIANPSVFVIFDIAQAYPEYIIEF